MVLKWLFKARFLIYVFLLFITIKVVPSPYFMLCFLVTNLFKTHLHCLNCFGSDYKEVYYERYSIENNIPASRAFKILNP